MVLCSYEPLQYLSGSTHMTLTIQPNPVSRGYWSCRQHNYVITCSYWVIMIVSTGPVLKNRVSSFKCLVWVVVRISSQNPFQRGWRTRISSPVWQRQTTGHTWSFIPERCASSLLSSVTVMPPHKQSDSKIQSISPSSPPFKANV